MQTIISKIRHEVSTYSKWFKVAVVILGLVYLALWLFTMNISRSQTERGEEFVLPVLPQDSAEYALLAESLIRGDGFSQEGILDTFRVPGYPLFVVFFKLLGGSYFFVTLIQILLVFVSAILLRRIGALFDSPVVGEISAVLILVNPVTIILTLTIFTDLLFFFLLISGFYLSISITENKWWKGVIVASIIFVSATYVRPMGFFALPIFVAPFIASRVMTWKQKITAFVSLVMIFVVMISPWIMRNYQKTGVVGFSSFRAMNMAFYAVPMFLANLNGVSENEERVYVEKASGIPRSEWRDIRSSKVLNDFAGKIILGHPFSYAKYHSITALPFFFSSTIEYALNIYNGAMGITVETSRGAIHHLAKGEIGAFVGAVMKIWWKTLERVGWLIIYMFAVIGLWIHKKNTIAWAFVFAALYLMMLAGPAASVRYALQAWPFIFLLGAAGMRFVFYRYIKKNK